MSHYMSHFTNGEALAEWETFADQLRRGILEWYDYWQDLDMRDGFEDGTRSLSEDERAKLEKIDAIVREHLPAMLVKHGRMEEYRTLGAHKPHDWWWWHVGKESFGQIV